MTITIEKETEFDLGLPYQEIIESVINEAMDFEECPYEAVVEVILTDNTGIHELNREHRGIDRPTDVLSFPMCDYPSPADFSDLEEAWDCFDPDSGELLLGDIVISLEKVREQAEEYGHSERRELAFLVAHSMLHLFGYDHMEEDERQIMEERQRGILDRLHITRDEE